MNKFYYLIVFAACFALGFDRFNPPVEAILPYCAGTFTKNGPGEFYDENNPNFIGVDYHVKLICTEHNTENKPLNWVGDPCAGCVKGRFQGSHDGFTWTDIYIENNTSYLAACDEEDNQNVMQAMDITKTHILDPNPVVIYEHYRHKLTGYLGGNCNNHAATPYHIETTYFFGEDD